MKKESIFIICLSLLPCFLKAQNLPIGMNSKLLKLSILNSISKPEIPYLSELKQIQSLKEFYDSLRSEIKEIQESTLDSATQDSILNQAKIRSQALLEKESQVLEGFAESLDPG